MQFDQVQVSIGPFHDLSVGSETTVSRGKALSLDIDEYMGKCHIDKDPTILMLSKEKKQAFMLKKYSKNARPKK